MQKLAEASCVSYKKGHKALDPKGANDLVARLDNWSLNTTATILYRQFSFSDYYQTMAFVNTVAMISHQQDHHPRMEVDYNQCRIEYSTHSAGGLTLNDFICAAKVDSVLVLCGERDAKASKQSDKAENTASTTAVSAEKFDDNDPHGRSYPELKVRSDSSDELSDANLEVDDHNDITMEEVVAFDRPVTLDDEKTVKVELDKLEDEELSLDEDDDDIGDKTQTLTLSEALSYRQGTAKAFNETQPHDLGDETLVLEEPPREKTQIINPNASEEWKPAVTENAEDDTISVDKNLFKQKK